MSDTDSTYQDDMADRLKKAGIDPSQWQDLQDTANAWGQNSGQQPGGDISRDNPYAPATDIGGVDENEPDYKADKGTYIGDVDAQPEEPDLLHGSEAHPIELPTPDDVAQTHPAVRGGGSHLVDLGNGRTGIMDADNRVSYVHQPKDYTSKWGSGDYENTIDSSNEDAQGDRAASDYQTRMAEALAARNRPAGPRPNQANADWIARVEDRDTPAGKLGLKKLDSYEDKLRAQLMRNRAPERGNALGDSSFETADDQQPRKVDRPETAPKVVANVQTPEEQAKAKAVADRLLKIRQSQIKQQQEHDARIEAERKAAAGQKLNPPKLPVQGFDAPRKLERLDQQGGATPQVAPRGNTAGFDGGPLQSQDQALPQRIEETGHFGPDESLSSNRPNRQSLGRPYSVMDEQQPDFDVRHPVDSLKNELRHDKEVIKGAIKDPSQYGRDVVDAAKDEWRRYTGGETAQDTQRRLWNDEASGRGDYAQPAGGEPIDFNQGGGQQQVDANGQIVNVPAQDVALTSPEHEAGLVNAYGQTQNAIRGVGAAEGAQQLSMADQLAKMGDDEKQYAKDARAAEQIRQAKMDRFREQISKQADDIATQQVDPDRYWKKKDASMAVFSMLALIAGGFSAGLHGTPNYAMEQINKQVDQDISAQKEDMLNKKTSLRTKENLLEQYRQQFGDDRAAESAARAHHLAGMQGYLESIKAQTSDPVVRARADALAAQLGIQMNKDIIALHKYIPAHQAMVGQMGLADSKLYVPAYGGVAWSEKDRDRLEGLNSAYRSIDTLAREAQSIRSRGGQYGLTDGDRAKLAQIQKSLVLKLNERDELKRLSKTDEDLQSQITGDPTAFVFNKNADALLQSLRTHNTQDEAREIRDAHLSEARTGFHPTTGERIVQFTGREVKPRNMQAPTGTGFTGVQ